MDLDRKENQMDRKRRRIATVALVVAGFALAVAAVAGAAQREDGRPVPTAVLRSVGGSGVDGSASFGPYPRGTNAALVVHGLRPRAFARARLHAGTSLKRLSASFAPLPDLYANGMGTARVQGRVLFRGIYDIELADVADGEHSVVVVARGRIVAFGRIPRD
jgi:hypothetical protein